MSGIAKTFLSANSLFMDDTTNSVSESIGNESDGYMYYHYHCKLSQEKRLHNILEHMRFISIKAKH